MFALVGDSINDLTSLMESPMMLKQSNNYEILDKDSWNWDQPAGSPMNLNSLVILYSSTNSKIIRKLLRV
jgi:hypothetical protein